MKIGVTLLFRRNDSKAIQGILKSTVIDLNDNNLEDVIDGVAKNISEFYGYEYIGLSDLFTVSGLPERGAFLGRTTSYSINNLELAKELLEDDYSFNENSKSTFYNCSIVYLCTNKENEKYTISVLSIVNSSVENLKKEIGLLAESNDFIEKIKSFSIEPIGDIQFVGIEDICDIDLKFNVFQSFYSDFNNEETLMEELLSNSEIEEILRDIKN